jgi:RNA polymerase sigma-70 factor (ECF subfamily)
MDRTDAQLIDAYIEGDEKAFEELVARYLKIIYGFVYRLTRNESETEDISQETFVKVWKNISKYNSGQSFKTWIFSIARNTAIDWFRKKKPLFFSTLAGNGEEASFEETISDPLPLPDELFEQKELGARIEKALAQVPFNYRTILVLHLNEGLTFEEIAKVEGRPMNTVKSLYHRGLLVLRQLLTDAPK